MKVKIIAVGKLKEKYLKEGIAEYSKRLRNIDIIEVSDEKAPEKLSEKEQLLIKEKEGKKILEKIKDQDYVFALAIEGKQRTSEEFAHELNQLAIHGHGQIVFVIGGSLGLSTEVMQRSDAQISFSQMTFPHQLMRLILLEQVYRAKMILQGSPYHK